MTDAAQDRKSQQSTGLSVDDLKNALPRNDARLRLEQICAKSGLKYEWSKYLDSDELWFKIGIPNGRNTRWRTISNTRASQFLDASVSTVKALGNYDAFYFADEMAIEASIVTLRRSYAIKSGFLDFPGVIVRSDIEDLEFDPDEEGGTTNINWSPIGGSKVRKDPEWRLPFTPRQASTWEAELRSATNRFMIFADPPSVARRTTIRIMGVQKEQHDELLRFLEQASSAIFFELDIRFNQALNLRRTRSARTPRRKVPIPEEGPRLPRNSYQDKPLQLYWYGRSAEGTPLLEFLAYYQVLEYYFPTYSQREVLGKLRNELLNPSFEPTHERDLIRILNLAKPRGKGYGNELEQLTATIHACATSEQIKELITETPERKDHFTNKPVIKGLAKIELDGQQDLRDQVASWIYKLRCRIVHTKEDGRDTQPDILLPFSAEAESLGPDIELVQFLAQRALIAGATRLNSP